MVSVIGTTQAWEIQIRCSGIAVWRQKWSQGLEASAQLVCSLGSLRSYKYLQFLSISRAISQTAWAGGGLHYCLRGSLENLPMALVCFVENPGQICFIL